MTTSDLLSRGHFPARFRDRQAAGQLLAGLLPEYEGRGDTLVFGIPRGGLPVALEVAKTLALPVDALVVQKVVLPMHSAWDQPPVGGALARGGTKVIDSERLARTQVQPEELERAIAVARDELSQREGLYRDGCPFPDIRDKTVIIVDDGVETGCTMRAAITAVRALRPSHVIVAVPVGTSAVCDELEALADVVVCPTRLPAYAPIHSYYDHFSKLGDEEVRALIEAEFRGHTFPCARMDQSGSTSSPKTAEDIRFLEVSP